ncbi:MAG: hypothetical protein Q8M73_11220 [Actinomycetota bacterium]|nr:hypothetical protein [Actinomycetota bacterium]
MNTIDPRPIRPADIVAALNHCDPDQLAAALSTCPDPAFAQLAEAVMDAAVRKATYPRERVIGEADALLYQVLRSPVADANPTGITMDPATYARHTGASIAEAERVLQHIAATESQACDQLLASGVEPNFTLEQAQVYDCILAIRGQQRVPTRQLLRHHATSVAASAMRPDEGNQPIIYAQDPMLRPRIVSPSPKVHALLWLDRMDANPPTVAILEERITYIYSVKCSIGDASVLADRLDARSRGAAIKPAQSSKLIGLHGGPGMQIAG